MRTRFAFLILLFSTITAFSQEISIIPQPVSLQTSPGKFIISKKTVIAARDEQDQKTAELLNEYLQQVYGFKLDIDKQESKNYIRLNTKKFIKAPDKDVYSLTVNKDGVSIEGDTYAGTFYGMQTLIQLLPITNISKTQPTNSHLNIPYVAIQDYPRFSYRGMHLDVGRHFFPISFVKKYLDYIALHKMNYFHWHLTEDQGWRIEIKKYPRLTEVGGYRNGTIIGRYPGTGNDNIRYGGFYTQEEVKDIVKYAAARHITVVPEIEMPGHSSAAIAAYPWLSCFPNEETIIPTHPSEVSKNMKGKKVQETWGVFDDVFCAGKDSTFLFLQDVLDEVLPLFPSQYVHVGGDESPKANWKRCPQCQARIKQEGLKDEHELQSYFIQRMEKYLNSKGKTLIGWDEILEGGLAPNAWVMSWRGEEGGIEAAKQNHNVIMTPGNYVYLDHSQTKNEDSVTIGGYTPVEKTYGYEPAPKELNADQAKYIKGAQGNVWTEYMKYPSKVEYMVFPRMSALSEVLWSPKEKKNWSNFEKRLQTQFKRYDLWKANYSKAYFDVKLSLSPTSNYQGVKLTAETKDKSGVIRYKTTGKENVAYTKPLLLNKSSGLVFSYNKNKQVVNHVAFPVSFNKVTGKKISIKNNPSENYPGQGGAFSLVNGIYSNKGLSYSDWLGWVGDDMEAVIDLGKKDNFSSVKMHTLEQSGS
jgi:hexosaminidase